MVDVHGRGRERVVGLDQHLPLFVVIIMPYAGPARLVPHDPAVETVILVRGDDDVAGILDLDQPVPGVVLERERRTETLGTGNLRGIAPGIVDGVNRTPPAS